MAVEATTFEGKTCKIKSIKQKTYIPADNSTYVQPATIAQLDGTKPYEKMRRSARFLCEQYTCTRKAPDSTIYAHDLVCGVDFKANTPAKLGTRYVQYTKKDGNAALTLLHPLFPRNENHTKQLLQKQSGRSNGLPTYYMMTEGTYIVKFHLERDCLNGKVTACNLMVYTTSVTGQNIDAKRVFLAENLVRKLMPGLDQQILQRGVFISDEELQKNN